MSAPYDVVVLGEILVELSTTAERLRDGTFVRLGFSGDALNVAAAAAAAGARTAVLARVADDELTDALEERLQELQVSSALLSRVPGQHGFYLVRSDPLGAREFTYARRSSAGSTLEVADVVAAGLESAGYVVASGIAAAISPTSYAAVQEAARRARAFAYDPNFRPRLTTASAAAEALRVLAPLADLVSPACPGETSVLLGTSDPVVAARTCRAWGARAAVVTCGPEGAFVDDGTPVLVPAVPAPAVVDQTGAGDCFLGTTVARLACGDPLVAAVRLGAAAASLSLTAQGGLGHVPSLEETRAHAGDVSGRAP